MEHTVCAAIRDRRLIEFSYKSKRRVVEPHLLGFPASGKLTLSAWQLSGGSGESWRDFHVAEMSNLSMLDEEFSGPRPGYNPNDRTLERIVCRL